MPKGPLEGLQKATGISSNEGWLDRLANMFVGEEGRGQSLTGKALTGLDQLTYGNASPDTGWSLGMAPIGPKGLSGLDPSFIYDDSGRMLSPISKAVDHYGKILPQVPHHRLGNVPGASVPANQPAGSAAYDAVLDRYTRGAPRPQFNPGHSIAQDPDQPLAWGSQMTDIPGGSTLPTQVGLSGTPHSTSGLNVEDIRRLRDTAQARFQKATVGVDPLGYLKK